MFHKNAGNSLLSWGTSNCWRRTLLHVCSSPMSRFSNICLWKLVWSWTHHKLAAAQGTAWYGIETSCSLLYPQRKEFMLSESCANSIQFSNAILSVACINILYFIFIKTFFNDYRFFRSDYEHCGITWDSNLCSNRCENLKFLYLQSSGMSHSVGR